MRPLVRTMLRGSLKQIRHVAPVAPREARGLAAEVYGQARREFGVLAPPLALHSPAPEVLAAAWLLLRETLLVEGRAGRAAKEAVATGVSQANECPYCVEVHQAKLQTLAGPDDDGLAALTDWARTLTAADRPRTPAPFPAGHTPELLGTAVVFHYLNRMVRLFLPDSPVPAAAPRAGRGPALRMVARAMRPDTGAAVTAGAALGLLPAAPLPAALAWAEPEPAVAGALARAVACVDAAAERWVPEPVRDVLHAELAVADGVPPGPSRAWLGPLTAPLAPGQSSAARLSLLIALAPHQITDADVTAFRADQPGDRELVELAAWASLTAAVRAGSRFTLPDPRPTAAPTTG
ncbi:carboxymuconolactone decarboxylase family protein (plasmid) [Streptomyces sp. NBC_00637]|uniref:carboxymuconolactone decarboxylase family protein n=1 Tax=Streptomyces sp. NBC_00637 TaxID=2903667 RepID=UPI00325187B3